MFVKTLWAGLASFRIGVVRSASVWVCIRPNRTSWLVLTKSTPFRVRFDKSVSVWIRIKVSSASKANIDRVQLQFYNKRVSFYVCKNTQISSKCKVTYYIFKFIPSLPRFFRNSCLTHSLCRATIDIWYKEPDNFKTEQMQMLLVKIHLFLKKGDILRFHWPIKIRMYIIYYKVLPNQFVDRLQINSPFKLE